MSLIHTQTPAELFEELVSDAMDHQNVRSSPEATAYLVQLLDAFVCPEQMFSRAEIPFDEPLSKIFLAAVSAGGMRRFNLFKLSGDLALFISGVFVDSLERRALDADYYGRLGGSAYASVAVSCRSRESATVFEELATGFERFVDILTEVGESCGLADDSDVLHLFERWQRTGSRHSAEALHRLGVSLGLGSGEVH
ncbi:MAG: hypothetical protein AAF657_25550 [Acidobacteriota bacterium]